MCPTAKLVVVEPPLDREDVMTIMGSLFDLNGKADEDHPDPDGRGR